MDKRAIVDRVKVAADTIVRHSPFPDLRRGALSHAAVTDVFRQYRQISFDFPRTLCTVAARITSDEARVGLISNLWDEHGRGNASDGHRAMFDAFLSGFDARLATQASAPTWQTRFFLNAIGGMAARGSLSEALGMLLFFEAVTPLEYRAIIAWLEKSSDLAEAQWRFWSDHVDHDGDHLRELLDITIKHEEIDEAALLDGVLQVQEVEALFWGQFENIGSASALSRSTR